MEVCLYNTGKFELIEAKLNKKGVKIDEAKLLFTAPLELISLVKQGEKWKIRFRFDKMERLDTIDTMLSFLTNKMHLDRKTSGYFAQFIYKYKSQQEEKNRFEIFYEPISVEDDIIKVNKTSKQPIAEIVQILSEIHKISTYPDSFLTTLLYSLLAPVSFDIRLRGEKFPYRLTAGRTHGGKTSDLKLIVLRGFDQSLRERAETMNTIKTIFTLGQKVEESRLPFIADDLNNAWLQSHAEELKGATDSVKFQVRGTRQQDRNTWNMLGMPEFTMNAEPQIPLALNDRTIVNRYTQEHSEKQNKREYERLSQALEPGFMFNLVKEVLEGQSIQNLLKTVHYAVGKDEEINQRLIDYSYSLLNGLFKKHGFDLKGSPLLESEPVFDLKKLFCVYVATRLLGRDKDGQTMQKFCWNTKTSEIMVTSAGYNDFKREYNIKLDSITDFVNELKDPNIELGYPARYIPCLNTTAYCIIIPADLIRETIPEDEKQELKAEMDEAERDKQTHDFKKELGL